MQDLGANQFGSFYLTAGLGSSLTSYVGRLRQSTGGRSLGASGAVYACFAATAVLHPGDISVMFVP
jgi:membrane associated rhomboid family serine protease